VGSLAETGRVRAALAVCGLDQLVFAGREVNVVEALTYLLAGRRSGHDLFYLRSGKRPSEAGGTRGATKRTRSLGAKKAKKANGPLHERKGKT
jgi:hypothetical protein